jgi:hypothetical protein
MSVSFVRKLIFSLVLALQLSTSGLLQAQTLKAPYVSLSPTAGPLWIAYEAGYFKKNNVSTELLYIPGGSTIIQAIISGDVRVGNMAPPSAIGAWAKRFDLTLIASGVDQLLETVVTSPAIKTAADLKNKKIGVSRFGSLTDMALREALRHQLKVLAKYLKITDRVILDESYEIYRPVYRKLPYGDKRAVKFAVDQMGKELPDASKLNAEDSLTTGSSRNWKRAVYRSNLGRIFETIKGIKHGCENQTSSDHKRQLRFVEPVLRSAIRYEDFKITPA